jgi:hypothetical protein
VVAGEPCRESARTLGEHLRGDDRVGLPRVAELSRPILRVAAGNPVDLVGSDPRLVLALEQLQIALAEQLEPALGDEPLLDDQEPVVAERLDLLGREGLDQERGLVLSGS